MGIVRNVQGASKHDRSAIQSKKECSSALNCVVVTARTRVEPDHDVQIGHHDVQIVPSPRRNKDYIRQHQERAWSLSYS